MSSPAAPPTPNYAGAAEATGESALASQQLATSENEINQNNPYGSIGYSYSMTPADQQAYDSALSTWDTDGQMGAAPTEQGYETATQTTSLNPLEQEALTAQQGVAAGESQTAENELEPQIASTMATPWSEQAPSMSSYMSDIPGVNTNAPQYNQNIANQYSQAAFNSEMGMEQPELQEQQQSTANQLALSGNAAGSTAYNNTERDLATNQAQQVNSLANSAELTGAQVGNENYESALAGYGAGNEAQSQDYGEGLQDYETAYNSALQNYGEPVSMLDSLLTGQSIEEPNFASYPEEGATGGTNYTGAENSLASWEQGLYNQQTAESNEDTQAGVGLASAGLMAMAMA